jgi:hypothetical protein
MLANLGVRGRYLLIDVWWEVFRCVRKIAKSDY